MNAIAKVRASWDKVTARWRRGVRLMHEIEVEQRDAVAAVEDEKDGADERAARTLFAWRVQIKALEQKEHRSLDDELQLVQLRKSVTTLDQASALRHPTPENMGPQRLAAFGQVGQPRGLLGSLPLPPALALLGNPLVWTAAAFAIPAAWGAVQSARLGHTEHQRDVAIEQANANATAAAQWEAQAHAYEQAAADARAAASTTARTLEAERQRQARARRREQERTRAIQEVIAHGDAPAWSLHDAPTDASPPSAPDGAPIGGHR